MPCSVAVGKDKRQWLYSRKPRLVITSKSGGLGFLVPRSASDRVIVYESARKRPALNIDRVAGQTISVDK